MTDAIDIANHPERNQYEMTSGGKLAALISYQRAGDRIDMQHTKVMPEHEGTGLGSQLASFALDDVRQQGHKVVATCSFVQSFIERHPQYQDLLDKA